MSKVMRLLSSLALLGTGNVYGEEAGHGAAHGAESPAKEVPFFWDATAATKAETDGAIKPNTEGGVIMSACFGLQSCAGFRQSGKDLIYSARDNKCNVKVTHIDVGLEMAGRRDDTSAASLEGLAYLCPKLKKVSDLPRPYDVMPTTFNFPVVYNTLDINGGDFRIERSDGTFTSPDCAILDPASEGNEGHTVTIFGIFGGRNPGQWPKSIMIEGGSKLKLYNNLLRKQINAKGLKLERETGGTEWKEGSPQYGYSMSYESGLVMLKAWAYKFTTTGEGSSNDCQQNFPTTTHVIKVMFNGGMTRNGIHPLVPSNTNLFTVILKRGRTLLFNKFIGLADLGTKGDSYKKYPEQYETDGDNYVDLCLQLAKGDSITDVTQVMVQANSLFPPRGTGQNVQHSVAVEHLKTNQYPYAMDVKTSSAKIFEIAALKIVGYVTVGTVATISAIVAPIAGLTMGVGLLFGEAYMPMG